MSYNLNPESNLDIALVINRYKNSVKLALQSLLSSNKDYNVINFNDSLFNFLNKICTYEHIKNVINSNDFSDVIKLLYLNNVNLFVHSNQAIQIINMIKENFDAISCVDILQEYYGPFKYDYIVKNIDDNFTLLLNLQQDEINKQTQNLTVELLQVNKIFDSNIINNINWQCLFTNLDQLEKIIGNFNLLEKHNIERFIIVFDCILNNQAFINLDFFVMSENINADVTNSMLNMCFDINELAKASNSRYNGYNYPKNEFMKRLEHFTMLVLDNTRNINNEAKKFMINAKSNNTMINDTDIINTYYGKLRDVDLDNKSVIYNYAANKNKQYKCNYELYKAIKFKGTTSSEDYCKPRNNFIRDMAYKFSAVYNKGLLRDTNMISVYFTIQQRQYLKDILYLKPGMILTLVTNTLADFTLPTNPNIADHFIHVYLKYDNIFLLLKDYGSNGVILPYGTQLKVESMIPIPSISHNETISKLADLKGNYIINATPINTLSLLPQFNINSFIQTSR